MEKVFAYDSVPPVRTKAGLLHGYQYDGIYIFKNIAYAKAERFQMPLPVDPWEGVKEATSYGFVCPLLSQDTPDDELMVPHRYWPVSENCQNLNIWTDSLDEKAKRPVMVWLHGGGFTAGSAIEQVAYDGFHLCRRGEVVVVSVNHRLNILGYLDMSPFGEQYKNSANAGHADLVAALTWIHDNIAAFGGDPDNVTLFGQSGGGLKITGLMNTPAADGLFHHAIVMSGVTDGRVIPEQKGDGKAIVGAILKELGLKRSEAEKLAGIPYTTLAGAYNKVLMKVTQDGAYVGCGPLKNDFYLGEPLLHGFSEHAKRIPLMIGTVFGEFALAPPQANILGISEQNASEILEKQYGEHTQELIKLFKETYPEKKIMDLQSMDYHLRHPTKALARLHAKEGKAPVYLYHFTLNFPLWQGKPAWHCSDIPFFFYNTELVENCGISDVSEKLQAQVAGAAVAFARSGDPNHDLLPLWPPVTTTEEPTMIFDRNCRVGVNYDDKLIDFAEQNLPSFDPTAL